MTSDEITAMWKGTSDLLELTDHPDFTRSDLFSAFAADPLGRHDLELQMLVSGVRGSARIPRFVLSRLGEGNGAGRWVIARISAERGGDSTLVTERIFDDIRTAERFVFDLRLQLLSELDLLAGGAGVDS